MLQGERARLLLAELPDVRDVVSLDGGPATWPEMMMGKKVLYTDSPYRSHASDIPTSHKRDVSLMDETELPENVVMSQFRKYGTRWHKPKDRPFIARLAIMMVLIGGGYAVLNEAEAVAAGTPQSGYLSNVTQQTESVFRHFNDARRTVFEVIR